MQFNKYTHIHRERERERERGTQKKQEREKRTILHINIEENIEVKVEKVEEK